LKLGAPLVTVEEPVQLFVRPLVLAVVLVVHLGPPEGAVGRAGAAHCISAAPGPERGGGGGVGAGS
jgi:hypothetical protein